MLKSIDMRERVFRETNRRIYKDGYSIPLCDDPSKHILLYVGHKEYHEIMSTHEYYASVDPMKRTFMGYPLIRVMEDSYFHVAVKEVRLLYQNYGPAAGKGGC